VFQVDDKSEESAEQNSSQAVASIANGPEPMTRLSEQHSDVPASLQQNQLCGPSQGNAVRILQDVQTWCEFSENKCIFCSWMSML
jgi:hypothetical protein